MMLKSGELNDRLQARVKELETELETVKKQLYVPMRPRELSKLVGRLRRYRFIDNEGHPLENCDEFVVILKAATACYFANKRLVDNEEKLDRLGDYVKRLADSSGEVLKLRQDIATLQDNIARLRNEREE